MRELSLHILDIVQNSIAAQSSRICIRVDADSGANRLSIRVVDNGRGMPPEFAARASDPFVTTRTTRKVGLGIPLLAAACKACEGAISVESAPGTGTTVEADFKLDHIDREPLGDIVSTIVDVIAANPDLALVYEHCVDGKCFVLDTEEIKAHLGGMAINAAQVLQWIREYLAQQIEQVGVIQ